MTQERIGWLRCLINSYRQEHDWNGDEDPTATHEMLRECEDLAAQLESELPTEEIQDATPPEAWDEIPF